MNQTDAATGPGYKPSPLLPGVLLQVAGSTVRIAECAEVGPWVLVDVNTGETKLCHREDLEEAVSHAVVRLLPPSTKVPTTEVPIHLRDEDQVLIDSIPPFMRSEAAIAVMLCKRDWLRRLKGHGVKSFVPDKYLEASLKEVEHSYSQRCPWSIHTLYDAARKLRDSDNDPRCLLPNFHRRGGPGGKRLHPEIEKIVDQVLSAAADSAYGRIQASRLHETVTQEVRQANRSQPSEPLQVPSAPTIARRVADRFTAFEVCVRNKGKDRAKKEFRHAGVRVRAERPLDVVQYDDMNTGVFLIDPRSGLPWGRAWLTSGVDECTSAPLGMSMSERPRSMESALEAIIHGIFPKDHSHPDFSACSGRWIFYGSHGLIELDNASYNGTMRLQATVLEFGCEVEFARPHQPQDKSDIEHFNHRVKSEFIVNEPGWAGPKEDREMLDYGLGTAVLTTDLFAKRLRRWTVDDYANKPLGTTGETPREAWAKHFELTQPWLPRRLPSQELMGTVIDELRFRDSGGLLRLGLRYQLPELQKLRERLGARAIVSIRYSLRTLEYLYVLDPFTKHYLRVPCIEDPRYVVGLTDYQQRLIRKRARHMKRHSTSIGDMVNARNALVEDTRKLACSKRMRQRKESVIVATSGLTAISLEPQIGTKPAGKAEMNDKLVMVSALEEMVLDMCDSEPDLEEDIVLLD